MGGRSRPFFVENKMKQSSVGKTLLAGIIFVLLLINGDVFAQDFKVEDARRAYVTKIVTAENVKGVEVRLFKEIMVDHCNTRSMSLSHVRVSGDGEGWHDQYFFDARMTQTAMFCPSDKPVRETIYSQSVFIKSFTNENVNHKVVVSIVIPDGYQLDVRAVK